MTTQMVIPTPANAPGATGHPLQAGTMLDPAAFAAIRSAMVLKHCKWDPQVGDVSTLACFPLFLSVATWRQLSILAEALAAETLAAEEELRHRVDLHKMLAIPWAIRRVLARGVDQSPGPVAARTMRFDFHWTTEGWRISEVNSDVPGGFAEASAFPKLMAAYYPNTTPAGNPIGAWADALARRTTASGMFALLTATGLMEDQQIMAYLARQLAERGCRSYLADPAQVCWQDGRAFLVGGGGLVAVDGMVRFFQAEWLARLPHGTPWRFFFQGSSTPLANPGTAILTESKRFPLVWPELRTALPTWSELLPETRDPRHAPWASDDGWLVKSAFCNTGDTVAARGLLGARDWRAVSRDVRWHPGDWVAQRRFETLPVETPLGSVYPCVGVYVIDGKAAGIYGRISPRSVIDFTASDVAVLIVPDDFFETRFLP